MASQKAAESEDESSSVSDEELHDEAERESSPTFTTENTSEW